MLFEIAAFLSTSGAFGGVAEAFGVHEINQQISSEVVMADPSIQDPANLLGPILAPNRQAGAARTLSSPVDPSLLPKLSGSALLNQLALQPKDDIATFVKNSPEAVGAMMVSPPKATLVTSWWSGLSSARQKTLLNAAPEYVGNLDGVPFEVRDKANRLYLRQSIATLQASIDSGVGRAQIVGKKHHLDILTQIERTLKTTAKEPKRQLVTFDPAHEGRAAVAVGDLATADYVSYLVPGMFFTVQGQMYDWTVIAQDLQQEQAGWIDRLAKTDPTMTGKTAATVSWIGYSTPDALDIASLKKADQGANYLGNAIQGIQASRTGAEPYVTLVTHSYGSTAAMIELSGKSISVDALAMVGSPGGATQLASKLSVRGDNVYVGEAAWDPVVNTAFYGSDPGAASFGARKMDVSGGTDVVTHKKLAAAVGHLGYFDSGTEAMRNLALIGIDQGALVTDGTLADATRTVAGGK
ncbi:alpha/beta hydrolase [Glaciihabitans sp. UYNi722]|uniref:alpha/beta hydrolase n=1 Tax=Glaciihabitans sp. UYNi722 TaxID=3156344 RepID=UPI00339953B3